MKLEQLLEGVPFTLVQGSLDTEVQDIIRPWLDTSIRATSQPASRNWRKVFCSS